MIYKNFLIYKLRECATGKYNFVARELAESGYVRKFFGDVHEDNYDDTVAMEELKNIIDKNI